MEKKKGKKNEIGRKLNEEGNQNKEISSREEWNKERKARKKKGT